MKKIKRSFWVFIAVAMLSACSLFRSGTAYDKIPPDVKTFLRTFENAVRANDIPKIMQLMDSEYVAEQHDGMLQGNTQQFIREFFCGNIMDGTGFECVNLLDVNSLRLLRLDENAGYYDVSYEINAKHIRIHTQWVIRIREQNGSPTLGLVGAMG